MVIKKKFYTVGVTGFAPFREYDYNTSVMVRDGVPALITRKDKLPITVFKYPHDIKCIYTDVLALTPELWSGKRSVYELGSSSHKTVDIDLMLHIGMHPDDDVYFFEKRARRGKYEHAGEDGRLLSRDALKGQPDRLFVELDVESIVARVVKSMPDNFGIKTSDDAGLYFCELITFCSLALLDKRQEFGRVAFLHVPKDRTEESIRRGVKVATALIVECVDSLPNDYKKIGRSS